MPENPTYAQTTASRLNGTRSRGPRNTRVTRENAKVHGFTSAIRPPENTQDRRLFDRLFTGMLEEFLPCGEAEFLVVEELVVLDLRRIRIQEALMSDFDPIDEGGLKRLQLLSRYETDTLNKIDKRRKYLHELQSGRARRRSLVVESNLVRGEVVAIRENQRDQAHALAERAIARELIDLAAPEEQARETLTSVVGSGSFRNNAYNVDDSRLGYPEHPGLMAGSPWDPWRGIAEEHLQELQRDLVEGQKADLRRRLADLEITEPAASCPDEA